MSEEMQGWKERNGNKVLIYANCQRRPTSPISDMYAEEKLKDLKRRFFSSTVLLKPLLVTFTDGNCKINRVSKEAAEQNQFTQQNELL